MKVTIKHLSHRYLTPGGSVTVLKDINLQLERDKTYALMGPSGSGKTTLFHILAGLHPIQSGEVWLEQWPWHEMSDDEKTRLRGQHLGIVFQNHLLVPYFTVWENLMLPIEIHEKTISSSAREQGELMLRRLGLWDKREQLAATLSGGESQRLAIARAMIRKPQLVLADEPTAQLDEDNALVAINLLTELVKENQSTLFLISHDPDIASHCESVFRLKQGQIISHETR
jgi:putative ABC transport system ATP-binding protein